MKVNYSKRPTAESFFLHKRATEANALNRIDRANAPAVCGMLMN